MINQKEFYQTKHYDDVVILDILSRYGTVVIVLKCLGIHLMKIVVWQTWPHCTYCFSGNTQCCLCQWYDLTAQSPDTGSHDIFAEGSTKFDKVC